MGESCIAGESARKEDMGEFVSSEEPAVIFIFPIRTGTIGRPAASR